MITIPSDIDKTKIPRHIAIIMDGNGRWARSRNLRRSQGHEKGADRVHPTVELCRDIGVEYVTIYAFSSENWKRSVLERNFLWRLLVFFLRKELPELHAKGVRLRAIGDLDALPNFAKKELNNSIAQLDYNRRITLTIALNYGSRAEIVAAAKKWCADVIANKAKMEQLDEAKFSRYLYTSDMPDPDLLIRTAGEMRVSNFLLYQISYAELYVTDTLWPDFDEKALFDAIRSYQKRVRRLGGVPVEEDTR